MGLTGLKSGCHWAVLFLEAPGEVLLSGLFQLPEEAACILWLVAPVPSSKAITPNSASVITSPSPTLTALYPSHNDLVIDYIGPTTYSRRISPFEDPYLQNLFCHIR